MNTQNTTRRFVAIVVVFALSLVALPAFAAEQATGKVNVNTASAEQLALLPRVGPAVAGRILEFRKENGPFKVLEDLMLVRGIGEKTFDLMAPYITLQGETTLKEKVRVPRAPRQEEEPAS